MIMTGRSLWHIPCRKKGEATGLIPKNPGDSSLPAVFNNAGYETVRTCKQGNSYDPANRKFQIRHDATRRGGTAETGSEWHGDQIMNYLTNREKQEARKPFLIYYGFSHPHDVRDGTPELLEKYGATNHTDRKSLPAANPKQPALPVNWLPKHPFPTGHPGLRDEVSVSGVWENRDESTIRNELGRDSHARKTSTSRSAACSTSSKPWASWKTPTSSTPPTTAWPSAATASRGNRTSTSTPSASPTSSRGPGVKKGRAEGNIYLLDTLATLTDLAGIAAPETNEGFSFVLTGEKPEVRDTLYGAYSGGTKPGIRCAKKGGWKIIKYDVLDGEVRETQLFNLAENPDEFLPEHEQADPKLTNLASNPAYADKLAEMEAILLAEMKQLDDPYTLWNQKK